VNLHPLGRRLFGILKKKAMAEWMKEKARDAETGVDTEMNMIWAIRCDAKAWKSVTKNQIQAS
jgi:hypothetical protein